MKILSINNLDDLRKILATDDGEETVINLEKNVYELYETIEVRRNNVTVNGNGSTIKGSKVIDVSTLPKTDEIVKINLKNYGIYNYITYGKAPFAWCGWRDLKEHKEPHDDFGVGLLGPLNSDHPTNNINNGPGMELFYQGNPMPISRYPRKGYMEIEKTLDESVPYLPGDNNPTKNGGAKGEFIPNDTTFTSFNKAEQAVLFGMWSFEWAPHHHLIKSVDTEKNIIEVLPPYDNWGYWDGRGEHGTHARFYAINVFEALDVEGSYFIDVETGELYVHPYPNQREVEVSVCGNAFFAQNVQNLRFDNFQIEQCRHCGFFFKNSSDILISNVSVRNVGEWGVIGELCSNMTVSDCNIAHTGSGGVYLSGGDRVNLISSGNSILNCDISYGAKWYRCKPGIQLYGVGVTVSGNKIHDLPHIAIIYMGNNHTIERNEIYRVCNESNDAGAIYTGRNYSCYGNIFRYNYFHDLAGLDGKGCTGLYFDDCGSSAEVYGNVFANMLHAIQLGGGHDHKIYNNVFYNCDFIIVDARGMVGHWMNCDMTSTARVMRDCLKRSPYRNDAWKKAYPELYNDDVDSDEFFQPLRNCITDNTFIECGNILFERTVPTQHITLKNNTFVKRRNQKVFSDEERSENLAYILRDYVPMIED
ncbi:MAG: right-handed parallel beta-helix repeat-containing protein [Clostridia bacterium]|nr:right-handed parallel beta-helix repeat-containing protein [Clostridia bacterium]MBQ8743531.1 right-handed parallel beta-helix repeat-containing protein [Clostridia bacterium]